MLIFNTRVLGYFALIFKCFPYVKVSRKAILWIYNLTKGDVFNPEERRKLYYLSYDFYFPDESSLYTNIRLILCELREFGPFRLLQNDIIFLSLWESFN